MPVLILNKIFIIDNQIWDMVLSLRIRELKVIESEISKPFESREIQKIEMEGVILDKPN